jgi:hypothetical protein
MNTRSQESGALPPVAEGEGASAPSLDSDLDLTKGSDHLKVRSICPIGKQPSVITLWHTPNHLRKHAELADTATFSLNTGACSVSLDLTQLQCEMLAEHLMTMAMRLALDSSTVPAADDEVRS